MAKLMKDKNLTSIKGIGIDEQTAVCIDNNGKGKVFGINYAYFLTNELDAPETCIPGTPLTWNFNKLAIKAYKIKGSPLGNGIFDATNWTFSEGSSFHYYVNAGNLSTTL
jgi:cyanophycinase-like exopeptidase